MRSFNTQPPEGGCSSSSTASPIHIQFQHTAARRRLPRRLQMRRRLHCCFNTQPPEGGCAPLPSSSTPPAAFQHTAARRRLPQKSYGCTPKERFQHTAARRRLRWAANRHLRETVVSTHSRPKAAAVVPGLERYLKQCFNTQPPEGGCASGPRASTKTFSVSTHSRPKAAALVCRIGTCFIGCFNTQPPEGGCKGSAYRNGVRPGFNTQPPEGGCLGRRWDATATVKFQHTAARRRLPHMDAERLAQGLVSTHSRPKAAAGGPA